MRIPTNNFSTSLIAQLQTLTASQAKLQQQVSTGQRITNASDDPAAMGRLLGISTEEAQLQTFANNNAHATDLSQATYATVSGLKTISDRAGELAVLGSGVTSPDSYQAYSTELNQLIEQGLQTANGKLGNSYLLAGTKTDTPPFTATRDASGNITGVTYGGSATASSFRISEDSQISPSTDGTTNQQMADFLNNLVSLRSALDSKSSSAVAGVQSGLNTSEDQLLNTVSGIGATQTRLEAESSQNQARFAQLNKLASQDSSVDIAQTVVKLTQAQTAYQAALQSGAQMLHTSLLDYLQ